MKNRARLREALYFLALLTAAAALLLHPERASAAVVQGLRLCGSVILPSLFPFFVCAALMTELSLTHIPARLFAPVMRPLFFDFPEDKKCWETEDVYMFGPDVLVAPVMELGARERTLYLPKGAEWKDAVSGNLYEGGRTVTVDAPLSVIPVFVRDGKDVKIF